MRFTGIYNRIIIIWFAEIMQKYEFALSAVSSEVALKLHCAEKSAVFIEVALSAVTEMTT